MMNATMYALAEALASMNPTADDLARFNAIVRGYASMQAPAPETPAPTPTPEQAPAHKERKPLEPATDVTLPVTVLKNGKGGIAFTVGSGAGKAGAKALIHEVGCKWDGEYPNPGSKYGKGAYVGTPAQAKALGLNAKSTTLKVAAKYVQMGRDKAQAKQERKERKAQA